MENKTCSNCGFIAQPSAEFCVSCGRELSSFVADNNKRQSAPENQLYSIQPFTGVGSVLNPTLKMFTTNFWFISKLVCVIFAPLELIKVLGIGAVDANWQNAFGAGLLWLICNALIAPSLIYSLVVQMRTGATPGLHEAYRYGLSRLIPFCACVALSWLLIGLGFVALIIPGIILSLAFQVVYPLATLEKGSPVEILKRSYRLTDGYKGTIFGAVFVLGLLCSAVGFPITTLSAVLIVSDHVFWPLQVALAILTDILNEVYTVLALVIYLSILSTAVRSETAENLSINLER
jgi:hypothetical protein